MRSRDALAIRKTTNVLRKKVRFLVIPAQKKTLFCISSSVSNCREEAQDDSSAETRADQTANRFGRDGNNCENEYLCKASCKYNPGKKTCEKSNCP